MKVAIPVFLLVAGALLGWRVYRAPELTWEPIRIPEKVGTPASVTGEIPAGYELVEYEVEGMHCGACSTRLYQALAALESVELAGVDHLTGRAQVVLPIGADDGPVLAACAAEEFPARRASGD